MHRDTHRGEVSPKVTLLIRFGKFCLSSNHCGILWSTWFFAWRYNQGKHLRLPLLVGCDKVYLWSNLIPFFDHQYFWKEAIDLFYLCFVSFMKLRWVSFVMTCFYFSSTFLNLIALFGLIINANNSRNSVLLFRVIRRLWVIKNKIWITFNFILFWWGLILFWVVKKASTYQHEWLDI